MRMVGNSKAAITVALLLLQLASCGGGGGGGSLAGDSGGGGSGSSNRLDQYVDVTMPTDGSGINYGASITFLVHNADMAENGNGVYELVFYNDSGSNEVLDSLSGVTEDSNGSVVWTPGFTFDESRQYWWKWSATFETGNGPVSVESDLMTFFVIKINAAQAISPRSGGYMDVNIASTPAIAVSNAYAQQGADVTYDMELYSDSALTNLVAYATGVEQDDSEEFTTFFPGGALDFNQTYYWQARPVIGGEPLDWRGVFSFTVKNLCEISGSRYAQNAISLTRGQECSLISFNDPAQALGSPNASGNNTFNYKGFVSLSRGGSVVLEMGRTIINRPGNDLRVWEYVSTEELEVFAGQSEIGPWFSLGVEWCEEFCDFDMGRAGLNYARFLRIKDVSSLDGGCYETAGADIDAVYALGAASGSGQCDLF